jgi:hypothetical protein
MQDHTDAIPRTPRDLNIVRTGETDYATDDFLSISERDKAYRKKYGLQNWKKYALYRHGDNPKFLNSSHGLQILKSMFQKDVKRELTALNDWMNEVERCSAELEKNLTNTMAENEILIAKVMHVMVIF